MTTVSYTPIIPGYQISSQLYVGSRTRVYRAIREQDKLPVVIKLLAAEYPSFNELLQFRNQYTIGKNLHIPGIIRPLSLEAYRNGYILVMADTGSVALHEYVKTTTFSVSEFLAIAIQLINILHSLHQNRVIHKDIKPANILIHPETKQVELIDFSIASLLPKETPEIKNPTVLEGTLAYISPEQTGRMNRAIDYRSDFYSLGVTFYELLTGELPFSCRDAMELVHCHIAKKPNEFKRAEIPQVVADIVSKLMAKNAEDRYQSALGLKSDLEKCLVEFEETGKVQYFEIAQWDVCDRFLIPEKLYGRKTEVAILLAAFERVANGTSEMMLVAGFSGIGKTAVINEIHKPITRQHGYFIKGKFDQFNRNIPFSAFVQALRDLMGQLLSESDAQLAQWQNQILAVVGENGQVLTEVIPELEKIIGKQSPAPELSGTAAQNRFNLLFQKFIAIFTTKEHPLVMFLDDLQWADLASLQLIKLLMEDKNYLLLLGAYRDNEVSLAHPFILTVEELKKTGKTVNTITLAPLEFSDVNQLVADTLHCSRERSHPLTELIVRKTQGNPFFTTQFLKALHEDGQIAFNPNQGYWECNITQIHALSLTDNVVEFMAQQLQKLPGETQNILKLAACIGNQFDLNTLGLVSEQLEADIATALWKALQSGLILPQSEVYKFYLSYDGEDTNISKIENVAYRFLHDRIQQAAYSLIPDNQKSATHYHIGQLLLKQISPAAKEERIFEIVNQLNHGTSLITEQIERDELAKLNLTACRKARISTAYQAAREYAAVGLSLLGKNAWEQQYEITLAFHELAAEVASLCGDFVQMEKFIDIVIAQAQSLLEKVKVYLIKIQSHISQNKFAQAIAIAQSLIQQLGVTFPQTPTPNDIQQEIIAIAQLIGDRKIEDLVHLNVMTDREKLAIVEIANSISPAAYLFGSPLFPLLVCLSVKLSIQYGNTSASGYSYSAYGIILCNVLEDVNRATQFGQLAFQVVSKLNAKAAKPEVLLILALFILHRKSHIKETLPLLQEGYATGLEVGNLEFAGHHAHQFCAHSFWCGESLTTLEQQTRAYCNDFMQLNQLTTANYCRIYWQPLLNLLSFTKNPTILSGEAFQEMEFLPLLRSANDVFGLYNFYLCKLMLCFLFGEIDSAKNYAIEVRKYVIGGAGMVSEPVFYLYDSLIALAQCNQDLDQESQALQAVAENQTKLKHWAHYAPMNHQHKFDLVEAEKYRVLGNNYEAGDWYDRATNGARENGYIQEEALANELAAKFYLELGKRKLAAGYMQEAYYCYARWGAKAKTSDLEKCYPDLLHPILQEAESNFNPLETLASIALPYVSIHESTKATRSSSSMNAMLDFANVLKASQSLSSTIQLDELLHQLTRIILQNSGGDRCALILANGDGVWEVRAIATPETTELFCEPLDGNRNVPVKLINYVKNTREVVLIEELKTDLPVIDEYLEQRQPKSLLCLPILNQGHLIGILYLKNRSTTGVFTSDRLLILNFLCTQAAISLENGRLHAQEQEKSAHLEQSQKRLQVIIQQTPIGVIEWNNCFEFQAWNPAAEKIFGYREEEILGKHLRLLIPEEHHVCLEDIAKSILMQSGGSHTINENLTKDGRRIVCEWFNAPIINCHGEICCGVSMVVDISDRKRAEAAIQQKSQDLETTLQELKQAQLQIVQSEKMASLGNLVAGVAHEVNNPIGFLNGSISNTKEYVQDLIAHLELYQQYHPQPATPIQDNAEEIDLEFLIADLPKLLDAMTEATKRIKSISNSLRTFSRADTDHKVIANLHEGIDSTLMILKYRIKANEHRPAIIIQQEYGQIPLIECFPGQLNQVFMNILANAIDMFDEMAQNRTFPELQAHPQKITITTEVIANQVYIRIKDNGKGMSAEVQQKIFDHLFTTKGVGKGTGLGLAIAREIVVQKHGGNIEVNSIVGEGTEFVIAIAAYTKKI